MGPNQVVFKPKSCTVCGSDQNGGGLVLIVCSLCGDATHLSICLCSSLPPETTLIELSMISACLPPNIMSRSEALLRKQNYLNHVIDMSLDDWECPKHRKIEIIDLCGSDDDDYNQPPPAKSHPSQKQIKSQPDSTGIVQRPNTSRPTLPSAPKGKGIMRMAPSNASTSSAATTPVAIHGPDYPRTQTQSSSKNSFPSRTKAVTNASASTTARSSKIIDLDTPPRPTSGKTKAAINIEVDDLLASVLESVAGSSGVDGASFLPVMKSEPVINPATSNVPTSINILPSKLGSGSPHTASENPATSASTRTVIDLNAPLRPKTAPVHRTAVGGERRPRPITINPSLLKPPNPDADRTSKSTGKPSQPTARLSSVVSAVASNSTQPSSQPARTSESRGNPRPQKLRTQQSFSTSLENLSITSRPGTPASTSGNSAAPSRSHTSTPQNDQWPTPSLALSHYKDGSGNTFVLFFHQSNVVLSSLTLVLSRRPSPVAKSMISTSGAPLPSTHSNSRKDKGKSTFPPAPQSKAGPSHEKRPPPAPHSLSRASEPSQSVHMDIDMHETAMEEMEIEDALRLRSAPLSPSPTPFKSSAPLPLILVPKRPVEWEVVLAEDPGGIIQKPLFALEQALWRRKREQGQALATVGRLFVYEGRDAAPRSIVKVEEMDHGLELSRARRAKFQAICLANDREKKEAFTWDFVRVKRRY